MSTYFIADLHLSPNTPHITRGFLKFLNQEARQAEAVYILGDLFEFWVGDDDDNPFNLSITSALKALTHSGVACYFIQGNRDFLVGDKFCQKTGVKLLPDEYVIDLYGTNTLIMHGDTLCTDDVKYQDFRKTVHKPWLQTIFNCIPLWIRQKIVQRVQNKAKQDKGDKSLTIMDVNTQAVIDAMNRHQVTQLIHGHTHRPMTHDYLPLNQTK
ncbi:MAG: UDP-2,3-diacylglucosamine diphosphatase, partial [Vibrio sp.]